MTLALRQKADEARKELRRWLLDLLHDGDSEPIVASLLRNAQDKEAIVAGLAERADADGSSIDSAALAMLADSIYHSDRHVALYVVLLRNNDVFDLGNALSVAFFEAPSTCPVDCFKPLAEFASEILARHDSIGLTDEMYENKNCCLKGVLDYVTPVINDVEMALGTTIDRELLFDSRLEVERERARETPQNDPLRRILRFLLAHWNDGSSPACIHRAMSALMSATGRWNETTQERIAFAQVCGACWHDCKSRMEGNAR